MPIGRLSWRFRLPTVLEEVIYSSREFNPVFQFALPYDEYFPPELPQDPRILAVTRQIPVKFLMPGLDMRFWKRGISAAPMTVPETPMNENDFAACRKDKVRGPRKRGHMKSIAIPQSMRNSSDCQFRAGIFRTDCGHDRGPRGSGNSVHTSRPPEQGMAILHVLLKRIQNNPSKQALIVLGNAFEVLAALAR